MILEQIIYKIVISLAVGALIGLEREFTKHQALIGVRTFALLSLLGMLSAEFAYLTSEFAIVVLAFLGSLGYAYLFLNRFAAKRFGLTTSVAIPVALLLGVLVGLGYLLESVSVAIIVVVVLAAKRYSRPFVERLTSDEFYDALEFAIVLFILYPLMPEHAIYVFGLALDLRLFLAIIILVSVISFAAFLLLRYLGVRALFLTSALSGLVNSALAVASFAHRSREAKASFASAFAGAGIASLARDTLLIAVFASYAMPALVKPLLAMGLGFAAFALLARKERELKIAFKQPFSVAWGVKFAVFFAFAMVLVQLVTNTFPSYLALVALLTGAVSSGAAIGSLALAHAPEPIYYLLAIFGSLSARAIIASLYGSPSFKRAALSQVAVAFLLGAAFYLL